MEAATKERELSGDKAQRIVDAMRDSVARRGAAGSTFEHVAREAGVSRGLLHYYFGTKERLLVEVVRRDAELRVARLDELLGRGADGRRRPRRPRLQPHRHDRERTRLLPPPLRAVQRRPPQPRHPARGRPALRTHPLPRRRGARAPRSSEGVLSLRFDAEAIVSYLFALGDGFALQALSDPERDNSAALEAGAASRPVPARRRVADVERAVSAMADNRTQSRPRE